MWHRIFLWSKFHFIFKFKLSFHSNIASLSYFFAFPKLKILLPQVCYKDLHWASDKYDHTLFSCFLKLSHSKYLFCHCSKLWNVDVDRFDWSIPVKLLNSDSIGVHTRLPVGAENRKQCLQFLLWKSNGRNFSVWKSSVLNLYQRKSSVINLFNWKSIASAICA